jgi:hypothetical protein
VRTGDIRAKPADVLGQFLFRHYHPTRTPQKPLGMTPSERSLRRNVRCDGVYGSRARNHPTSVPVRNYPYSMSAVNELGR